MSFITTYGLPEYIGTSAKENSGITSGAVVDRLSSNDSFEFSSCIVSCDSEVGAITVSTVSEELSGIVSSIDSIDWIEEGPVVFVGDSEHPDSSRAIVEIIDTSQIFEFFIFGISPLLFYRENVQQNLLYFLMSIHLSLMIRMYQMDKLDSIYIK